MISPGKIAHIEAWATLSTWVAEEIIIFDDSLPLHIVIGSYAMPFTNPLSLVCNTPPMVA